MSTLTARARAAALARAKEAMGQLEANPANGQRALGYGRDALNTVWNSTDTTAVHEAVALLEEMAHQIGAAA
ncbi:hypothetical protein GCM10028801_44860 [Nocardioides maradonensis]